MGAGVPQANRFYEQVASARMLWFAEDKNGMALELETGGVQVCFPLWSSSSRVDRVKKSNAELLSAYSSRQISWDDFIEILVPILVSKDRLVGVNLSGKGLTGIDISVDLLIKQVEAHW